MVGQRKFSDLFPTRWSFIIFILYMGLFINQGILVTASQTSNHQGYTYNTVVAVLLTELIKLWVSAGIFIQSVHSKSNTVIFDASSWLLANEGSSTSTASTLNASSQKSQSHKSIVFKSTAAIIYKKCKCQFCCVIFHRYIKLLRHSAAVFCAELKQNQRVFFLYFVPAGLYCLYNNLAYTNLLNFDPTTYFLLLQFRVVVTGVVFQILFKKQLSKYQWASLIFLTLGCMIKEMNFGWLLDPDEISGEGPRVTQGPVAGKAGHNVKKLGILDNPFGVVLILLQVLCSSSAGVYNEFLLKRPTTNNQKQLPVLIQNVCLYIDSILCNLALLLVQGNIASVMNFGALKLILTTPIVLAVVLNNAAIGIVTSFFLAQLNSILKTFASALELMFTAVLCWLIFDIPIYANTAIAIFIVTLAIWLYSKEPVHNPATVVHPTGSKFKDQEDMQKMLDEELEV